MWPGWPSALQQPDRPAADARILRGSLRPHSEPYAAARQRVLPSTSVRPVQRSCRDGPLVPPSAHRPRSPPPPARSPRLAHRNLALHMPLSPEPAAPSGPTYRSASMAASLNTHTPPAPCTQAAAPKDTGATLPLLSLLRRCRSPPPWCSRPPAVCLRSYPRAPAPPLPAPLHAPSGSLRSLQALPDILAASPESRSVPQTRWSRLPSTSLDPLSCTSALARPPQTDCSQTAPPSPPPDANTHAPLPLLLCRSLPLPQLAPVLHSHPTHRPSCWPAVAPGLSPLFLPLPLRCSPPLPPTRPPPCTQSARSGCRCGSQVAAAPLSAPVQATGLPRQTPGISPECWPRPLLLPTALACA